MGMAATAFSDEGVTQQPCGVSANTGHPRPAVHLRLGARVHPLINGSDTNFSQPFVLTYPNDSVPADKPRPQLVVTNITGLSNGHGSPQLGTVKVSQLWGADFGVLH